MHASILLMVIFYIYFLFNSMRTGKSDVEDSQIKYSLFQNELKKYNNLKKYVLFNNNIIFLDYLNNRIIKIVVGKNFCFKTSHFNFKNITEINLIIDVENLNSTSKKEYINNLFLEDSEKLIDVLLDRILSKKVITQVYIELSLLSNNNSISNIIFIDIKNPADKLYLELKEILVQMIEVGNAINDHLYQNKKVNFIRENMNSVSTADEINKLHKLFEKGILTEEEFALQKEKILSS